MTPNEERAAHVRALIEAVNARDWEAWESLRVRGSRDFVYDLSRSRGLLQGVYGYEQVPQLIEDYLAPWEQVRFVLEDFIEIGDNLVTPFSSHHRGRDGIELTASAAWLWVFEDGVLVRQCVYQELEEALAAAG